MQSKSVRVIATLKAKPEKIHELRALLSSLIEPTRAEAGCLMYELWHNQADDTDFRFIEHWASSEALQNHFDTPHIKTALSQLPDLLVGELDLRQYGLVS